jgi:hypothetical protein
VGRIPATSVILLNYDGKSVLHLVVKRSIIEFEARIGQLEGVFKVRLGDYPESFSIVLDVDL